MQARIKSNTARDTKVGSGQESKRLSSTGPQHPQLFSKKASAMTARQTTKFPKHNKLDLSSIINFDSGEHQMQQSLLDIHHDLYG